MSRWSQTGALSIERSANVMSMFFAQSRHGFHATVGAVVLTYLFFREMPLRSACPSTLIDSAAELIGFAVLIASWHPRCEDTDCLFGTAPLTHMRCDASWCLCQEQFTDTETNKICFLLQ